MTQPPALPTLEDVARAAGVSTATVSRCLNGTDRVSPDTRAKVMQTVEALGYTPNFGARAMAAKRTATIGAIIPTMDNAIFARGLQAFQERLTDLGYTLLVASNAYRPDLEADQIRALVARGAEGLLLIGYARDPAITDFLDRRGIPSLITWAHVPDQTRPAIGFDNRAAMAAMARHVIATGHRRIGVITAPTAHNDRAAARLSGIRDALHEAGRDPSTLPVIETPYGIDTGAAAFARLMADHAPSVVMCVNDVLAAGALLQARRMGLAVPEDVSVTGFDDIELARISVPELTTVHVPHRQMGTLAADALIAMVADKQPGQSHILQTRLVLRASLGPPSRTDPGLR